MGIDEQAIGEDLGARVRALLDEHDPTSSDPRDFLAARFDAGLAWVHFPRGSGGLELPRSCQSQVEAELAARRRGTKRHRDGHGGADDRRVR
jgi:hypothetical protein